MIRTLAIAFCLCSFSWSLPAGDVPPGPVKVFVLAGQSNMQGHGRISLGKEGDLAHAATLDEFAYLKRGDEWVERDDVFYYHLNGKGEVSKGRLRPGLGANETSVGPELAFGHVLGEHFDEPVLLVKCAWGGQAIAMTFRPPSSKLPPNDQVDEMFERAQRKNPKMTRAEFEQIFGSKYRQMLAEVRDTLENLGERLPALEGRDHEIVGFLWHQGWNDGTNRTFAEEYEANMSNFIADVRRDLGDPDLPFVIATSGMGGPDATGVAGYLGKSIEPAQRTAAEKHERCVAVPTRHFQRHQPGRQKSHWYNSAESYCLVGDAAAKAMIELLNEK